MLDAVCTEIKVHRGNECKLLHVGLDMELAEFFRNVDCQKSDTPHKRCV